MSSTAEWLTIEDICQLLQADRRTVRNWLRTGRLHGVNFGGQMGWRIRRYDLETFIAELEGRPASPLSLQVSLVQQPESLAGDVGQSGGGLLPHYRPDGISLVDGCGAILQAVPLGGPILGYNPRDFVGHLPVDLLHPEDRRAVDPTIAQLVQDPGKPVITEVRVRHSKGSWRWLEIIAVNLLEEAGVQAIAVCYRDITRDKEAEERQRRSTESVRVAAATEFLEGFLSGFSKCQCDPR